MNRGAQAMNAFQYSMQLRGLKHGSEEEYNMFEDIAVCRARNRRMNGAAESKLQLEQPLVEDPAASHVEVEVEIEQESRCCGEHHGEQGGEGDKGRESGEDPVLRLHAPHPSTPNTDNKVLQITIQVNGGVQHETKCGKFDDRPQAKLDM